MIDFLKTIGIKIPEGVAVKIEAAGKTLWQVVTEKFKNWVLYSINADGTIYNGTGYKIGYRIRSGGAEGSSGKATCTGFIPAKAGDVIRISGCDFDWVTSANAINVSDASFANLGQFTSQPANSGVITSSYGWSSVVEETTGVWKWVVPQVSTISYIRVTGYDNTAAVGDALIVTVNEEIV